MLEGTGGTLRADQPLHPFVRDHANHPVWIRAAQYCASNALNSAILGYCRTVTAEPPHAWPGNKIFAQRHRYITCFTLVALDARFRAGQSPPPSLKMLQASVPSSPRQVSSLISGLRAGGHIHADVNARDLRSIHLRPSISLIEAVARSPLGFLTAADKLDAGEHLLPRMQDRMDLVADCMAFAEESYQARDMFFSPFRDIVAFADRDCGYSLLCAVMGRYLADQAGESWDLALNYDSLSVRFKVSRQHVGNLLTSAAARGLFDIRSGRIVKMEANLVWQFQTWSAGQMALYRRSAEGVLGRMPVQVSEAAPAALVF